MKCLQFYACWILHEPQMSTKTTLNFDAEWPKLQNTLQPTILEREQHLGGMSMYSRINTAKYLNE